MPRIKRDYTAERYRFSKGPNKGDQNKAFKDVYRDAQSMNEYFERDHSAQAASIRRYNKLPRGDTLDKTTKAREKNFERSFNSLLATFKILPLAHLKKLNAEESERPQTGTFDLTDKKQLPSKIIYRAPQYKHLALIGQAIDPATRKKMLLTVIKKAEKNKATEIVQRALMVAVDKHIHGALQGRTHLLDVADHVKYLQDRHALTPRAFEKPNAALKGQFKDVAAKIAAHGNHRARNTFYRQLAAVQPKRMALGTLAKIIPTFSRISPKKGAQKTIRASLEDRLAMLSSSTNHNTMIDDAIHEITLRIRYLRSPVEQVAAYQKLAALDLHAVTKKNFLEEAHALTQKRKPGKSKDAALILLRDNAVTEDMREKIHKEFISQASFQALANDIVSLRQCYDTQRNLPANDPGRNAPNPFALLGWSWKEMETRKQTWSTADQRVYEARKPLVERFYPSSKP